MSTERVKVLLVDDRAENLATLEALLKSDQIEFFRASSGVQALTYLLDHEFALALLDVQMPEMNGIELAELMRGSARTRSVPIIFVTAAGSDERRTFAGYEAGAVDFLYKPLDPHIVRSKVQVFVELHRQKQLLANTQLWLEGVLNRLPVPVFFHDPQSKQVTFTNRGGQRLTDGQPPESLLQKAESPLPWERAAVGELVRGEELTWTTPEGGRTFLVSCERVPANHDRSETVLTTALDISQLKQAERDLEKALHVRDEFIALASHELRTPLTALKLQIARLTRQLGQTGRLDPSMVQTGLNRSQRQIDRLERLITDMLDLTRIMNGKLSMEFERVNLTLIIRDVLNEFQEQLDEVGCEIELPDVELEGSCDAARLHQVFSNLITNALKYGERKKVAIRVQVVGEELTFEVEDHGRGIPKTEHERIFQRFVRVNATAGASGLGLGLYIVRQIVDAHHGTIAVRSAMGQGAIFTVRLPIVSQRDASSKPESSTLEQEPVSWEGRRTAGLTH